MRIRFHRLIPITILVLASASVLAAGGVRYKWKDAQGNLHYSDTLPPEAGVLGYEVISGQGIVVKRVEPAKSREELAIAKQDENRKKASQDEVNRRQREDQQLLAANPSEKDLIASQRQQLAMIDQNISSARAGLQSHERILADLLGRAAELERNDKPVPTKLGGQIADMRKQIEQQHGLIDRRVKERETAVNEFATELDRYRNLIAPPQP